MARFILTNKAIEDLSEIWNYTFDEWSEEQADKYYDLLLACCQDLANHPNFGKIHDGIRKGLFGFKANHHIIFYRITATNEIEIARILHEKMDLKSKF